MVSGWTFGELSERGAAMADLSTDYADIAFWTRYALGMAMADSLDVERGAEAEAFRRRTAVAIRRDVAYSAVAS